MRVTGVVIGGRGGGIGLRLPDGGGMRVTGVETSRGGIGAGTGACGVVFGTGGIGADCIEGAGGRGRGGGVGMVVTGVAIGAFGIRLAARIYCARAACCSGVAVLFATASRMALNSGLAEAISVKALTVSWLECEAVEVAAGAVAGGRGFGGGAGFGALTAFGGFSAFSAFSSTLRTDRNRVSGKIWGPMTTGHTPKRVVMYCELAGGSFRPRRVGFHTFGKWYPCTQSSRDCNSAVERTPL